MHNNCYALTDLYAEIILCEHIKKVDDVNLPWAVLASDSEGNPKTTFSELEVFSSTNDNMYSIVQRV